MIDTPENETIIDEDNFASMLDAYDYEMPYRGQILEGVIIEAASDEILLDVGLKRDAIVTRKDLSLLTDELRETLTPGKEVLAYVLQPRDNDGELIVSINKALELEDWTNVKDLMAEDSIIEARVIDTNKGGMLVSFGRLTGFVPQSHVISLPRFASQYELEDAKKQLIGKKLQLKFIEVDRRRNRLIMSERSARIEMQQNRLSELQEGDVVKGHVVSIVDFGAFVDLGGVDGLIHISKLAHNHVNHPGEVLAVGDEVEVMIDSIDKDRQRISLDRKALIPDPWDSVEEEYSPDDLVLCTVTNVVDFGAFAQLPNGLQGLVHVSEMSMFGISNPRDLLREGDEILARILSIESEDHRIALSMDKVTVEEQEEWMHNRHEGEEGEITPLANNIPDDDIPAASDEYEDDDIPAASVEEV